MYEMISPTIIYYIALLEQRLVIDFTADLFTSISMTQEQKMIVKVSGRFGSWINLYNKQQMVIVSISA